MKNITYINAGAGSGKTYRLTEEMVERVTQGHCTPSQIIASTFTIDAAADLKKNAREKFLQNNLFTEAAELDSAAIGTVHSIGLQYIKKYWYKLGLTASVETITDDVKMSYLNRTLSRVVTDADMAAFREFTETFCIKKTASTKLNYDFWKVLVQDLVEKADAFGISNLNDSEKKSIELAEVLLAPNGCFSFMKERTLSEDILRNMYYDCIHRIFDIARKWNVLFNRFKEEHGLIEFNDMETKFIQLLNDPEVRDEISRSVKYVFVDEFQDSNPKQIMIFDLLSDLVERSFWVGDPKQAIYSFRGCDTVLVQALTDRIVEESKNPTSGMAYETLKESHRSVKPLVDTTSEVFTKVFGNLDPEMVKLTAHRKESMPGNAPALWHWEQKKKATTGRAAKEDLFKSIALQIRNIVDGEGEIKQVIDKNSGQARPVKYSDIAVLARRNEDVDSITAELNAKDIPVVCENIVDCNCKELRLVRLLLNYMIDDSPLLRAEIAHLLFGKETSEVIENKQQVLALADFAKLDDLKDRLKTLPVADIVKTLVIELDLINQCHKWGVAAQRERTLQAVIEDARAFDETAETMGEASSIEHYLDHLDREGVTVNEGFFQEGVRVMTYHGSKGLQWHIVIMCSLDDDMLNEKKMKKRFALGVNYVRKTQPNAQQLYSDYYLTCLPTFLASSNSNLPQEMLLDIGRLDTYTQYAERQRYESRRILYVGVTRARDYLITTSLEGKKMAWLTDAGIEPVRNATDKDQAIWGTGKDISKSRFVKVADDGNYESLPEPAQYSCRNGVTAPQPSEEKRLSPSKMVNPALTAKVKPKIIYPIKDTTPRPIHVGSGDEYDIMGTCIHNIFAVYNPSDNTMCGKAQRIIEAYGMEKMLPDVDGILLSIEGLYAFLEQAYGNAVKVEHEVPFQHDKAGQVVVGEMDLLWYTAPNECVLIDFKNYPGIMSNVMDNTKEEYVGKYAAQLNAYEEALVVSGVKVKEKLIYYSVLGKLVSLS